MIKLIKMFVRSYELKCKASKIILICYAKTRKIKLQKQIENMLKILHLL